MNSNRIIYASADSGTEAISGSGTVVLTSGTLTATGGKGGNVDDRMPECKGGHGAAGTGITFSDSADGTTWTANSGTSSTQKYVKAE